MKAKGQVFENDVGSVKSCRISKDEDFENDFEFGIQEINDYIKWELVLPCERV